MMQRRMRWLATGLLLAITTTASAETPALPASLAAALAAADTPIAHVAVPEPSRRVGEVRVHRHGGVRIVQTMLYTKLLERVVAEIARKEAANWPPERAGHADAERYIAALREAAAMIPKPKAGDRTVDRRRKLLIEFVIDDDPTQISHHGGAETRRCRGRQRAPLHAGRHEFHADRFSPSRCASSDNSWATRSVELYSTPPGARRRARPASIIPSMRKSFPRIAVRESLRHVSVNPLRARRVQLGAPAAQADHDPTVVRCSDETSGIAAVVFSSFEAAEVAGEVRLTQRRPLLWLALSRDYVATNMDLIVADSFHLDAAGVAALWAKASGGGDEAGGAPK